MGYLTSEVINLYADIAFAVLESRIAFRDCLSDRCTLSKQCPNHTTCFASPVKGGDLFVIEHSLLDYLTVIHVYECGWNFHISSARPEFSSVHRGLYGDRNMRPALCCLRLVFASRRFMSGVHKEHLLAKDSSGNGHDLPLIVPPEPSAVRITQVWLPTCQEKALSRGTCCSRV